jgi:diguanylate cyclase (GGDEF)-like protein
MGSALPDLRAPVFQEMLAGLAPGAIIASTLPPAARGTGANIHTLVPPLDPVTVRETLVRLVETHAPASAPPVLSSILHSLNHVESIIEEATRPATALTGVCREMISVAGADAVSIYLLQTPEPCFVTASTLPVNAAHLRRLTIETEQTFVQLTGVPPPSVTLKADAHPDHAATKPLPPFAKMLRIPLLADHQIKGVLCAAWSSPEEFPPYVASILFHLANHAVLTSHEVWRARSMAAHDQLTGLFNKGMFNESLKQTFSLAQRKGTSVGLLLFDFDNLKGINDQHGHLVGDKVLREAASLTLATVRTSDIVSRFGGDEFAVILPDTDLPAVRRAAERLLTAFRDRHFAAPGQRLRGTISIGVSAMRPAKGLSSHMLLSLADEGLLAAKRAGKDRWSEAPDSSADITLPALPAGAGTPDAAAPRGRVLVLDDEKGVRDILEKMLRLLKFEVVTSATLADALQKVETATEEFDIVLTDLRLGNGTGIDLLQALKDKAPWTVKMVISGYASKETAIECLRHGAFDFIEKPFAYNHLVAAIDRAMEHRRLLLANRHYQVHLEELVRVRSESLSLALDTLRRSYSQTIQTLALMVDMRAADTGRHCRAVREAVRLLARRMDISHHDLETIEMGAVLHDIGKIAIPDGILQKPGPLTPDERRIIQTHPQIGHDILVGIPFLHDAAEIVLRHHESFDGSGYPFGLKGSEICIGARLFAVVDSYHAMRSERVYRPAMDEKSARDEIVRCSGSQFDPLVVAAFLKCQAEIEEAFATPHTDASKLT